MLEMRPIDVLNNLKNHTLWPQSYRLTESEAKTCIKALEEAVNKPKTGHWIMSDDGLYRPICDNCGAHPWKGYIPTVEEATEVFKYCPSCGSYNGGD